MNYWRDVLKRTQHCFRGTLARHGQLHFNHEKTSDKANWGIINKITDHHPSRWWKLDWEIFTNWRRVKHTKCILNATWDPGSDLKTEKKKKEINGKIGEIQVRLTVYLIVSYQCNFLLLDTVMWFCKMLVLRKVAG